MNVKIFEEQYAQAARNILLKSYHTKITICRIAEEVGVSESTLKRAFKNCFNIGVLGAIEIEFFPVLLAQDSGMRITPVPNYLE